MAPLPVKLVTTTASIRSASVASSAAAREVCTPPPAMIIGRAPALSSVAAWLMLAGSATVRNAGARTVRSSTSRSPSAPAHSASSTLCGMTSATGPGRPLVARRNAARTRSGSVCASGTASVAFVIADRKPIWSKPCDATPLCRSGAQPAGSSPTRAMTGIDAL